MFMGPGFRRDDDQESILVMAVALSGRRRRALALRLPVIRLALREVGLSAASLHAHRKRWPAFDAACEVALVRGYENLDTGLAFEACRLFDPDHYPQPEAPVVAPMTPSAAISLMRLHEKRRWEGERGIGPCGRVWRWRQSGAR
jgi:hypothetical protein